MRVRGWVGSGSLIGWGLLLALEILVALVSPAAAGENGWAQASGFRLGIYGSGAGIGAEDPGASDGTDDLFVDESGSGMALMVGYTVSRRVSLYLATSFSEHETNRPGLETYYTTVAIEGHFQLMPRERVRPYLMGGLGGVGLTLDAEAYDSKTSGGVATAGLGLLWNITEHLLLDTALRLDFIEWDEIEFSRELANGSEIKLQNPVDEDGGAGRFQLGLTWAF